MASLGACCNPEAFSYGVEAYEACKKRSLARDIIDEQKKVQEADLVIFQFPLYWLSVPAILKGWMDRVLCQGFAFDLPGYYDSGFLKGKLALLSLTTGGNTEMYSKSGATGDFRYFLWPLQASSMKSWRHVRGSACAPPPQRSPLPAAAGSEHRRHLLFVIQPIGNALRPDLDTSGLYSCSALLVDGRLDKKRRLCPSQPTVGLGAQGASPGRHHDRGGGAHEQPA
ncbi:PREDICTED: ribosyldihydronicotinamide dehydrogenase [quinone]-like [Chrysochloris asiatica]|uniref:Ribosyldihydronicotinamide dehydrogenase [quinone]-like n=1 Tax=Chrysochloris asiatica TaxID=185453 RepID=A0A9B0TTM9_CHRAS|nr:PREDICTED: ribosyldihydronicotinamide dehydrogenase [quinone]-like [Chrysochloris asiatica]